MGRVAWLLSAACVVSACGESTTVRGVAEKGPFLAGTQVTVVPLGSADDAKKKRHVELTDDSSAYAVALEYEGWIQLTAEGRYFGELTGAPSESAVVLHGWAKVGGGSGARANVNVLTHLTYGRASALHAEGLLRKEAQAQAEIDLAQSFGLSPITDQLNARLSAVSLFDGPEVGRDYLLVVSVLLSGESAEGLDELAVDLADDGRLNAPRHGWAPRPNLWGISHTQLQRASQNLSSRMGEPAPTGRAIVDMVSTCGNDRVELGEDCDDPSRLIRYGCTVDCRLPICGDGRTDDGEVCCGSAEALGTSLQSVKIADQDGDGWPDLLGVDASNEWVVLSQDADGVLSSPTVIAGVGSVPADGCAWAVGDLNHDQSLDLVFLQDGDVVTALSRTTGYVTTHDPIATHGGVLSHVAVGDLNLDGDSDLGLVETVGNAQTIHTRLGDGTGGWRDPFESTGAGFDVAQVPVSGCGTIIDVDHDGAADFVYAHEANITAGFGNSTGGTSEPVTLANAGCSVHHSCRQIAFGDFDGDERLDVIQEHDHGGWLWRQEVARELTLYEVDTFGVPFDLDNDGIDDVVGEGRVLIGDPSAPLVSFVLHDMEARPHAVGSLGMSGAIELVTRESRYVCGSDE